MTTTCGYASLTATDQDVVFHPPNMIPYDQVTNIMWILDFIVIPIISILGLAGNVTSIIIIRINGLHRPSNILLMALAVADFCFLAEVTNVLILIYRYSGEEPGFHSEADGYAMYSFYQAIDTIYRVGLFCSMTLPVLITIDRLIAVFSPIHFKIWVTPFRTKVAVLALYVLFGGVACYFPFCFEFVQVPANNHFNQSVGRITLGHRSFHPSFFILLQIINNMTQTIPTAFVLIGCIVIGIKVKFTTAFRHKMMSSLGNPRNNKSGMSKTTRNLMAVCVVYSIVACTGYAIFLSNPEGVNLEAILRIIRKLILCLSNSCNFLIYVAFNPKFRATLLAIRIQRPSVRTNVTASKNMSTVGISKHPTRDQKL